MSPREKQAKLAAFLNDDNTEAPRTRKRAREELAGMRIHFSSCADDHNSLALQPRRFLHQK